jgi:hypothetical protein
MKRMKIKLRRKQKVLGNGQTVNSHYILEWNPYNGTWYPINEKKVSPSLYADITAYRNKMNRVIKGETVEFRAEYRYPEKMLEVVLA